MEVPFVFDDFKNMSALMIIDILNELKYTNHSIHEIAENHLISDRTVINIFDSRVSYTHGIPTSYMCIDEKCFEHGKTKFMLVIMDFKTNTLLEWLRYIRDNYIVPPADSSMDTSSAYNQGDKRKVILKAFCIDMNQTYYDSINSIFPYVPIAVDSFHVIKNINEALNRERIKVMNRYYNNTAIYNDNGELLDEEASDEKQPFEYRLLKKYWKLFLITKDPYTATPDQKPYNKILGRYADAKDILDYCLKIDPILQRAWELKEQYCYFNRNATFENATEWLETIIANYLSSNISSFIKLAQMLVHWKQEIINSFVRVDGRRLSNGGMEGINSKIETVIINSRGVHNFDRMRNRLLLRFGNQKGYYINRINTDNK